MEANELNHLFEQMSPTPEQEEAILARLQAPKQEGARPMKHIQKTAVVLAAAALLLATCAFAVASTLDPRLLSFFQRTPQDTELLADGIVEVDQSHTYPNGWTVEVEQVLADQYVLNVLVEVTAPEDAPLPTGLSYLTLHIENTQEERSTSSVSGSRLLEDEDPGDNRYTFLCYRTPGPASTQWTDRPSSVRITPLDLWSDTSVGPVIDFRGDDWSCTADLPAEDNGQEFPAGHTLLVGNETVTVTYLYLSPISCVLRINGPAHSPFLTGRDGLSSLEGKVFLHLKDGSAVSMYSYNSSYNPDSGDGAFILQNAQIIDPDQVESITILEQTFPLTP